jgi:iron complex transport system permease protein
VTVLVDETADVEPAPRPRARRHRLLWLAGLGAALSAAVALSLAVGSNPLTPAETLGTLTGGGTDETRYIVWELRVPRTIAGLLVGAALGVSGALIQAFTRNPLADPGILGVNAGAAFFVALAIAFLGAGAVTEYIWFAFGGALVVTVAVYLIGASGRGAADPVRLVLAGVAVGAVLSGITTGLTLSLPTTFDRMRHWNAGTLLGRGLDVIVPVAPFIGVGLLLALAASSALNSMALGEDVARSQGVNMALTRSVVIVAITLLAGAATAIAGPVSFVGLMIPHVIRWMLGPDQRLIVALAVVASPILLLTSDVLGRLLVLPGEMPVGIVTAFIGAPVLVVLVRRRTASAL